MQRRLSVRPWTASTMGSMCQKPNWKRRLVLSPETSRDTNSARPDMAASMAAKTPSNRIDIDPDSRPKTTPNSETTTATPIERRSILCSAAAGSMPQSNALEREDQAGRGAMRQELAGAVDQPPLGGGNARADIDDLALGFDRAGLVGHGAHVVDLDLERGEAVARLQGRVDGAAHHRIEQCCSDAAMDAAQRVIVLEHRVVGEHHASELNLRHAKTQGAPARLPRQAPRHPFPRPSPP